MSLLTSLLLLFNGDGVMSPEKHLDQLFTICDIHLVTYDYVMVRVFLKP